MLSITVHFESCTPGAFRGRPLDIRAAPHLHRLVAGQTPATLIQFESMSTVGLRHEMVRRRRRPRLPERADAFREA